MMLRNYPRNQLLVSSLVPLLARKGSAKSTLKPHLDHHHVGPHSSLVQSRTHWVRSACLLGILNLARYLGTHLLSPSSWTMRSKSSMVFLATPRRMIMRIRTAESPITPCITTSSGRWRLHQRFPQSNRGLSTFLTRRPHPIFSSPARLAVENPLF